MLRKFLAQAVSVLLCCGGMGAQAISIIGWNGEGSYGTSGADGVVPASPLAGQYGWVSSVSGLPNLGLSGIGGVGSATTGSRIRTPVFTANAGQELTFYFDYVTSDGAGYADYAWARLLDNNLNEVALLFTARTTDGGNTVPGFSMPAPLATLVPAATPIIGGGPVWSPLGPNSGSCYANGCGHTGWIQARYTLPAGGSFILEIGVVNWNDTSYQSGMAFDGLLLDGEGIEGVTPVTLGSMTAQRVEGGVMLSWDTVMELNNLGFYLYRSTSPDGERVLVNTELIAGTGTSDGTSYSFLDAAAPDGPVFYWLEDVSTTFESELHGQVAIVGVQPDDETAGLTIGPEAGVYRVSYETLKAAGLPVDLMNPGDLKLNVDGEEAALFVSAWKGPMQAGDYVLFYAAAGEGERAVSVQSGVEARRMEYAYAGPSEEGDVWVGQAGEGLLAFETQAEVSRYFVLGLPDNQALVLDVTAAQPKLLYGYAWVNQAQGDALYMSYETEQPAKLLAVAESAIRDVIAP